MATESEPIYQVKLLAALRTGDLATIQPYLSDIHKHAQDKDNDFGALALHLAIRCASVETVQLLLNQRSISPNATHPPNSLTTPLHLAASIGRADVVALLLDQPEINDTARDAQGKTALEVARTKQVQQIISDSQSLLQESFRSLLRTYVLSPINASPPPSLLRLLTSPRARLLDLSYLDESTGTTLLHEAAKRKDMKLMEHAVHAGADVFVRDRKGRGVAEVAGKDERVKAYLKQFANQDISLLDIPSSEPPVLRGYLSKYGNVAKGYGTRWFVLKDGILYYYRHRDDENYACRGSISMHSATLKTNSGGDRLRFEIKTATSPATGSTPSLIGTNTPTQKWWMKANHPAEVARWTNAIQRSIEWCKRERDKDKASSSASVKTKRSRRQTKTASVGSSMVGLGDSGVMVAGHEEISGSTSLDGESMSSESGSQDTEVPPYEDQFELHANTTTTQLELTSHLRLPPQSPELTECLSLVRKYVDMVREREEWWRERVKREKEKVGVWEESLGIVVREGEALERELRERAGKRKSRIVSTAHPNSADPFDRGFSLSSPPEPMNADAAQDVPESSLPSSSALKTPTPQHPEPSTPVPAVRPSQPIPVPVAPPPPPLEEEDIDTDEEDEFFDAIEANTLPNLVVSAPLAATPKAPIQSAFLDPEIFSSYAHLRSKMPISDDNRPSISLWSALRNNIGKDLTKISFPVSFNEPTSMLQRMAEDMEFSECLDAAAAEEDPHRRIAFVAAFAMSNYSSTIGRIAKPFNPMLGETFEYVRFDKHYRYMSEQVSHHPPISACWAESPKWHYYGEVDAQNKFMGKSFEIRPTGVAHVDLKIPQEWVRGTVSRASSKEPEKADTVTEHYSWKKVTTNVSGFILGSPTIDHYGEMTVVNHRTGEKCILTFKPRGWRGKDAYEISGRVLDSSGRPTYEIAGRWNSQLVARAVSPDGSILGGHFPDVSESSGFSSPSSLTEHRYILLWRNTPKPKAPFNLTPFAITLNDLPADLQPVLCPTDCRLRPDQRAFENGEYDLANELKSKQEDFQRQNRKRREERGETWHARWFDKSVDPDTGERVWQPRRKGDGLEYWAARERIVKDSSTADTWVDVQKIFIDTPKQ
ncbi:hypothetical protein SISNIDRAFT_456375 [Sistotremastrum niveocremeum HHB9708]|uniref:PH domain-containing protein n=1 Tax=Sistotremastrum niveocremeum HHB9708 TaxID=1314777 RepID=A0A164STP6_9AGAM|nr:hypothetical protein SISNIDRAFT_456375 [Sistotremastrum niveocremeum HHB9708]